MARILVVDDDRTMSSMLAEMIRRMGYPVTQAYTLQDGFQEAQYKPYDVVFLDVNMPDGSGLDWITHIKQCPSNPEVIIITGFGNPDAAETAIESGAWDYIEKPSSLSEMTLPLARALQYREAKGINSKKSISLVTEGILGDSPAIKTCLKQVHDVAASDANVLITGETGTGKELFAQAIHNNSVRTSKSFVVVDCAALTDSLVESSLFGHERGAFTGADKARRGLVMEAHEGTLFLDEVGELPLSIQKSFLRVLQEKRFRPIGGKAEDESNFRLIAATNRDLDTMVKEGQFRNDLLFRIRSLTIELPPLRERREDIKTIAEYHNTKICERYKIKVKVFSPDFVDALSAYDWPGNVRELINTLERIIASARGEPVLYSKHLPKEIRIQAVRAAVKKDQEPIPANIAHPLPVNLPSFADFRENALATLEKDYLTRLMNLTNGNIPYACKVSGMSRSRLYEILRRHKIRQEL